MLTSEVKAVLSKTERAKHPNNDHEFRIELKRYSIRSQKKSFLRIVLIRITILCATKSLVAHQDTGVRSIAEFRKLDLSCIESIALGKHEYH